MRYESKTFYQKFNGIKIPGFLRLPVPCLRRRAAGRQALQAGRNDYLALPHDNYFRIVNS
jgi:hypothetical protein